MATKEYAAILARVSTIEQLNNTSPEEQLRRGREYCKAKGYSVFTEKIEAISGTVVLARSGFNDLLTLGEEGKINVIVVDIPDRLGRGDAIAKLELLAQLCGLRVEYAQPGRDTSTVEGMIQHSAEQMVSGIERMNIRRRMTEGRRALAKAGRVIGTSFRVFGLDIVTEYDDRGKKKDCYMVIREEEAKTVVMIFEWCAFEGLSAYAIAKRLTQMGIPTMSDIDSHVRKQGRKRAQWARSSVTGILNNRTYIGEWAYAKRVVTAHDTPEGVTTTSRKSDNPIPVNVPAIVSKELFDLAHKQLAKHKKQGNKPTKYAYLLRGRIRCARCNSALQGQTKTQPKADGSHYWYYRCRKNQPDYYTERCPACQADGALIEAAVWQFVCEQMQDEGKLFEKVNEDRVRNERAGRMVQGSLAALEAQNQKARLKIARYLDLYGNEGMSKDEYLSKKETIEGEIEERNKEKRDLESQLCAHSILTLEQETELRRLQKDIAERLSPDNSFEEKVRLFELLNLSCVYDDRTQEVLIGGVLRGRASLTKGSLCAAPHPE